MFGGKTLAPALRVSPMEQAEAASSGEDQHDNRGRERLVSPFISSHLNNQDGLPVSPPPGSREESPVPALPPSLVHVPPFTEDDVEYHKVVVLNWKTIVRNWKVVWGKRRRRRWTKRTKTRRMSGGRLKW